MTFITRSCPTACSYSVKSSPEDAQFFLGIRNLILQDSAYATDITISCDGRLFEAHKVLLAFCSPYFKDIIAKHFTDSAKAVIILGQTSAPCLDYLLKFIYKGEVEVQGKDMHKFLETGATLKIRGLLNGDIKFMKPTEERSNCELFDESIYDHQPETPGKHLVRHTKKRLAKSKKAKTSSSSKNADTSPGNEASNKGYNQQNKDDQEQTVYRIPHKTHTPSSSHFDSRDSKHSLLPHQSLANQAEKKSTVDSTFTQTYLSQNGTAVPIDPNAKPQTLTQKIKLVQQDLNDSDSDSSDNALEDGEEISSESDDSSVDDDQGEPEIIDLETETNTGSQTRVPESQREPLKLPTRPNNPLEQKRMNNSNTNDIPSTNLASSVTHTGNRSKLEPDVTKVSPLKRSAGNDISLQPNKKVAFPATNSSKTASTNLPQSSSHDVGQKRKSVPQDATAATDYKSTQGGLSNFKIPIKPNENKKSKVL